MADRSFRVRQATIDDLDRVLKVWTAGVESSLGTPPPPTHNYKEYFAERLLDQTDIFSFTVAESAEGEVIGWISLAPFRSNPAVKGVMAEMSAYVDPAHVASGVTGFAVKSVLARADASDLQYVVAFTLESNTGVLTLCERFGFKRVGTYPVSPKAPDAAPLVYLVRPCARPAS